MDTMSTERRVERVAWGIIVAFAVCVVAGVWFGYRRSIERDRERTRIVQEEKTKRTKERSDTVKAIVPWAKEKK